MGGFRVCIYMFTTVYRNLSVSGLSAVLINLDKHSPLFLTPPYLPLRPVSPALGGVYAAKAFGAARGVPDHHSTLFFPKVLC